MRLLKKTTNKVNFKRRVGGQRILVTDQVTGKDKSMRVHVRKTKCSTPRQLCLSCQCVISKRDTNYKSKICKECTPSMAENDGIVPSVASSTNVVAATPGFNLDQVLKGKLSKRDPLVRDDKRRKYMSRVLMQDLRNAEDAAKLVRGETLARVLTLASHAFKHGSVNEADHAWLKQVAAQSSQNVAVREQLAVLIKRIER